MAGASQVKAGQAWVEIGAKDDKLRAALRRASARVKAFGASLAGIGTRLAGFGLGALAGLGAITKVFSDMGAELLDLSQRTGVSVEALGELGFAAKQSGADMETLEMGLKGMQKTLAAAAQGNAAANEQLARLGLTIQDLQGLSPDQQFRKLAAALIKIPDASKRNALALEIFDRAGMKLIPTMLDLEKQTKRLQELGGPLTTEQAEAAEAFGDVLGEVAFVVKKFVAEVGGALVPALKEMLQQFIPIIKSVTDWVIENKGLVLGIGLVTAGVTALGFALAGLGVVVGGFAFALGALAVALKLVFAALSLLLSGPGLLVLALVAAAGAVLYFSGALDGIGDLLGDLGETFSSTWQGIKDALAGGDLALAMNVAWSGLKLAWAQGLAFLAKAWRTFRDFFLDAGGQALAGYRLMWEDFQAALVAGTMILGQTLLRIFADTFMQIGTVIDTALMHIQRFATVASRLKLPGAKELAGALAEFRVAGGLAGQIEAGLGGAQANMAALVEEARRQRMANIRAIVEEHEAAIAARGAARDAENRADRERIAALRQEHAKLVEEAAAAARRGNLSWLDAFKKRAKEIARDLGQDQMGPAKRAVTGGFSGALLGLMGPGSIDAKQLKELQKLNAQHQQLLDIARKGGIVFAFT